VRVGVLGVELDRFLVLVDGHVRAVRGEETSQVVVRRRAVRFQLERGEVLLQRLAVELLLAVDGGEVVVRVRRLRVQLDGLLEFADGLVQPSSVCELDAPRIVLVGADRAVPVAAHGAVF